MTKQQAIDKARQESRNGQVQHVNYIPQTGNRYTVSDWYSEDTIISFENGKEK